ncbi:MAG: AlkA N-terminal domain-containing protein [Polyangiaceae bacterium]
MTLSFEQCERARRARDARYDGRFFTAVKTTGVYCRPVCPARQPKRANVEYFPSAALAAQAGYRPCLRCRPETAPRSPSWQGTVSTVKRALRLIHEGALVDEDTGGLAERLGVSDRHLRRLFEAHVGVSPQAYALNHRLLFAKQLLAETGLPVIDVAFASGFRSRRRFNDAFRRQFMLPPSSVRQASQADGTDVVVRLRYRPPFDFQHLLRFFVARAVAGVEHVESDGYARTFSLAEGHGWFHVFQSRGGDSALMVRLGFNQPTVLLPALQRIRQIFDLDAAPLEVRRALRRDAVLKALLRRSGVLRLPGAWSEFEALVRGVVGQQVSVKGARTVLSRLCERFGRPLDTPLGVWRVFPAAEALADADLAACGLTRSRADAVRGVARRYAEGFEVGDGELVDRVERLCSLPGIGPWTANLTCLRALQEPDAFPAGDLGIRKALGMIGAPLQRVEARADAWRPWRGYAAMLLWHSLGD